MFVLHFGWHWYRGPWEKTLPGYLGVKWWVAVDGAKGGSVLLALLSLVITVQVFRRKEYFHGVLTLPTCLLSLLTVPIQT